MSVFITLLVNFFRSGNATGDPGPKGSKGEKGSKGDGPYTPPDPTGITFILFVQGWLSPIKLINYMHLML